MAEKRAAPAASEASATPVASTAPGDYLVTVKLPKLRGKNPEQDKIVSVNGKVWQIQRGVEVQVPYSVYLVLLHSEKAADEAEDFEILKANA